MTVIGNRSTFGPLPGGGYRLDLIDDAVQIDGRYIRREPRGDLVGEIDVRCEWAGVPHYVGSLACGNHRLTDLGDRRRLAMYCAARAKTKPDDFDWLTPITAFCLDVIAAERHGTDPIVLDDAPDVRERDHDVDGLLVPGDAASLIIAPGDSLKSLITLRVLGTLAQRGIPVLYSDWEWTPDRHKRRKRRLFGSDRLDALHYQQCRAPLTVEADRLRRFCDREGIAFLAIDSVGMAADGKLVDDDTARRFHQTLAGIRPALCAAHVAKHALDADVKTDPHAFGSVYCENLCRMAWIVKRLPSERDDDICTVGLFRTKQNDGARAPAVGWTFDFTAGPDGPITVTSADLATIDGFADRLPIWRRMAAALKTGPQTLAALADGIGATVDSVDRTVRRQKAVFTRVTHADGVARIALVEQRYGAGGR